jgi:hypothetical protein
MPTSTYDLIASNVLTTSAASVTFSSISGSYRDLIIVAEVQSDIANDGFEIRFNGDTGSNYERVVANSESGTVLSASGTSTRFIVSQNQGSVGNTGKSLLLFQVFDYAQTDKHKSALGRTNGIPKDFVGMAAFRWASTSAVTSIYVGSTSNFVSGSSFYLYGIVS